MYRSTPNSTGTPPGNPQAFKLVKFWLLLTYLHVVKRKHELNMQFIDL